MITFKEDLKESSEISREDFATEVEKAFKKHFPNGSFVFQGGALGGDASINFTGGLIDSDNRLDRMNDVLQISAWMHDSVDSEGMMLDKITLEWDNSQMLVKPEEGSHMAMGRVKLGLRKKTGTPQVVLKAIVNSFKKSAGIVKKNIDDVYGHDQIDPKYLKINA